MQCKGNGQLICQRTNLSKYIIDHKIWKLTSSSFSLGCLKNSYSSASEVCPLLMVQSTKDLKKLKRQSNIQISRASYLHLMAFPKVKNQIPSWPWHMFRESVCFISAPHSFKIFVHRFFFKQTQKECIAYEQPNIRKWNGYPHRKLDFLIFS